MELYQRTPRKPRDYWLMTELFVELHGGDECEVGKWSLKDGGTTSRRGIVTEKLKPCPLKHPVSRGVVGPIINRTRMRRRYCVSCQDCGALGPLMDTPEEAIAAWNREATSEGEPA